MIYQTSTLSERMLAFPVKLPVEKKGSQEISVSEL
jgi:hypothetical protein